MVFPRSISLACAASQLQYTDSSDADTDTTPAAITSRSNPRGGNPRGGNTITSHPNAAAAKSNAVMKTDSEVTATVPE